jgi:hypothetical protein
VQRRQCAGFEERIGQRDLFERRMRAGAHQQPRDRFAEPAVDGMVLGNDDHASRLCAGLENCRLIKRLDGGTVEHGDANAIGFEVLGRLERAHGH